MICGRIVGIEVLFFVFCFVSSEFLCQDGLEAESMLNFGKGIPGQARNDEMLHGMTNFNTTLLTGA